MKHLKIFENANNLYQKITTVEFENEVWGKNLSIALAKKYRHDKWKEFKDSELERINNMIEPYKLKGKLSDKTGVFGTPHATIRINTNDDKKVADLFRLEDEWYYLSFEYGFRSQVNFKCDQLDGLLSAIQDVVLKNTN